MPKRNKYVNKVNNGYYVAGIIARWQAGKLQVVVMKTKKLLGKDAGLELIMFPGGMEEASDCGDKRTTLFREVWQETDLIIVNKAAAELLTEININGHCRSFYLVWAWNCRGTLRRIMKKEKRKLLYLPCWVDVETLDTIEPKFAGTQKFVLPILKERFLKKEGKNSSAKNDLRYCVAS